MSPGVRTLVLTLLQGCRSPWDSDQCGDRVGASHSGDSGGAAAGSSDDGECGRGVPFDFKSVGAWRDSDSRNNGDEGGAVGSSGGDNKGGTQGPTEHSGRVRFHRR